MTTALRQHQANNRIRALELHNDGIPHREIAVMLGLTYGTVRRFLRNAPRPQSRAEQVAAEAAAGARPAPGWEEHAACRGTDPDGRVFFSGDGRGEHPDRAAARALCAACPASTDCLLHALLLPEPHGIWAGTTPLQRAELRRYHGLNEGTP